MIRSSERDWGKVVDDYCDSVLQGRRVVGRYERLAVERYRRELEEAPARGLYLDAAIAQRACHYFEVGIRHSMAEWKGQPFVLDPWQAFVVYQLQGWRHADTKLRRFRKAYITLGRKNGKTTLAAGLAIQLLHHDIPHEPEARGFAAATKKEQAALLWKECKRMVEGTPWLLKRTKIMGGDHLTGGQLIVRHGPQKGSVLVALGADSRTQSGLNASFVIKDEIHEWADKHRGLSEKLDTAGGSRRQALVITTTTAGDDNSQLWDEEHEHACRVVESGARGEAVGDELFAFIAQIDEEDDPLDFSCWPKANPNMGVSLKEEFLKAQHAEAIAKPSARNQVIRYHCNRRVASFEQAFPEDVWNRGREPFVPPARKDVCFLSFDLSFSNDWSAVAAVFPQFHEGEWRYVVRTKTWACKGVNSKTDYTSPPYSLWIQDGLLEFQHGEVLDRVPIKAHLVQLAKTYRVKQVPYDQYGADELATDLLNEYRMPLEPFPQTANHFHEPLKSFEGALLSGRIDHGNDPVLNWQAGNCQLIVNSAGRCMLDKGNEQRWKKIDTMVTVIMAYGAAVRYSKKVKRGAAVLS